MSAIAPAGKVNSVAGRAETVAIKENTGKQSATVDLDKLRQELNQYLDDFSKKRPFPNSRRPLDLKKLYVVAFVQNDDTKEVLQAAQVKIQR